MKALDRYLQNARIRKARKYIKKNGVILDIGSPEGALFEKCKEKISYGYGIDPTLKEEKKATFYTLIPGTFPEAVPKGLTFDTVLMLAVLEHIPKNMHVSLSEGIYGLLNPGGKLIITVPSPKVDNILKVLLKLNLVDGMSLEEHYGFDHRNTEKIFSKGYRLLVWRKFQFGLNNLFVFEKVG